LATKKKKEDADSMARRQREIAVSEFFSKNRHLLGFDNPTKAILTTVREAVDNALDACEEAHILPEIAVTVTELKEEAEGRFRITIEDNGPGIVKAQMSKIFGKLLYGSKFHRLKQSRGQQGIGISAAVMYGQMTTGQPATVISKTGKGRPAHLMHLQIDTKKNKPQILDDIELDDPHWNEKKSGTSISIVLEGNYRGGKTGVEAYLRQTALANPHARIRFTDPKGDTFDNPRVSHDPPVKPKEIKPHPHGIELGTLMHMLMDAKGQTVTTFMKDTFSRVSAGAAKEITAKAKISPRMKADAAGRTEAEALYKAIQDTKILAPPTNCLSPIGEDAIIKGLYWLFVQAQKEEALAKERAKEEAAVEAAAAKGQPSLDLKAKDIPQPAAEGTPQVKKEGEGEVQIQVKLDEDKAVASDEDGYFVTAVTRSPQVYRGNPFQVEVGLFYGKGLAADELARVYRFANRVPLQYQTAACAIHKSVISAPWKSYGLTQGRGALPTGPLVVMVHIASAWVPYTSESKEAIAHYPEILKEFRLALLECGRRLQRFLKRKRREADEAKKRQYIIKYMDPIGEALQEILGFSDKAKHDTVDSLKVILEETRAGPTPKAKKKSKAKRK
jgi:DNA topoisomerase-6 subunit B